MESDQIVISSGHVPFACGGPIYVPDLVSPITSVAVFKFAILRELQGLEAELVPAVDDFDGELSVDELRVFSEEELVERALGEGFEDSSGNAGPSQLTENANGEPMDHPSVAGKEIVCSGDSAIENEDMGSSASLSTSAMETMASCSGKKLQSKRSKKRGRVFDRHSRAAELENAIALLAYDDPVISCVGYLLKQSQLEFVVDAVNAVVLSTNPNMKNTESCLEKLLRHLSACILERWALSEKQGLAFDLHREQCRWGWKCLDN